MEFEEEHEDQDDEIMEDTTPISHHSLTYDSTPSPARKPPSAAGTNFRYRECLKNHAIGIGGHAVDGCGEFMPAGEDGSIDALKCAACNCHRNFHRKETDSDQGVGVGGGGGGGVGVGGQSYYYHHPHPHPHQQLSSSYRGPPPSYVYLAGAPFQQRPLALPAASGGGEEDASNPSSSGGGGGGGSKKRFRTKFSAEQKEKMLGFAERVGWTIQKHDEADVERFCRETGVRRQVLKVWMHNNKHTLGTKP